MRWRIHLLVLLLFVGPWNNELGAQQVLEAESYEIRWFVDGRIPSSVEEWFAQFVIDSEVIDRESRVDLYLITGTEFVSPKLRGNGLELKFRTTRLPIEACGISGGLENWTKWRWDYESLVEPDRVNAAFRAHEEDRAAMAKDRRQVKFLVGPDGADPVPMARRLKAGAVLELTALESWGMPFWTVAVDVFGVQGASISDVQPLLCEILAEFPVPLVKEASRGYSGWLREHVR